MLEVQVRGLDQLERAWPAFARRDADAMQAVAQKLTEIVAQQTAIKVPHRTGALAGSVQGERASGGVAPSASVTLGEGIPYGRWMEFGKRRGRAPRGGRYLLPTAKRQKYVLRDRAKKATQETIARFPWPNPSR